MKDPTDFKAEKHHPSASDPPSAPDQHNAGDRKPETRDLERRGFPEAGPHNSTLGLPDATDINPCYIPFVGDDPTAPPNIFQPKQPGNKEDEALDDLEHAGIPRNPAQVEAALAENRHLQLGDFAPQLSVDTCIGVLRGRLLGLRTTSQDELASLCEQIFGEVWDPTVHYSATVKALIEVEAPRVAAIADHLKEACQGNGQAASHLLRAVQTGFAYAMLAGSGGSAELARISPNGFAFRRPPTTRDRILSPDWFPRYLGEANMTALAKADKSIATLVLGNRLGLAGKDIATLVEREGKPFTIEACGKPVRCIVHEGRTRYCLSDAIAAAGLNKGQIERLNRRIPPEDIAVLKMPGDQDGHAVTQDLNMVMGAIFLDVIKRRKDATVKGTEA